VLARGLAVVILAAYITEQAALALRDDWTVRRNLPLHLTDAVSIVSALALWTGRPLLFELTYFWALTASLQAILTPSLSDGFPDLYFWTYFLTHGGAVAAAVLLTVGRRLAPRPGAVRRTFLITAAFAAVAGLASALTGGNYMWLRAKPDAASLLDVMGSWPWYIAVGAALGLALFLALDAPFRRRQRAG
jgi:hypothetical integral membrane protein (TIGR02206 family)